MDVHPREEQVVVVLDGDLVARGVGAHVAEGLVDDVVDDLAGEREPDVAVLELGHGEEVLDGAVEPLGVVVDVGDELGLALLGERLGRCEQDVGVAGDGGQGRPEVMRDRPQQIGPELLVLGEDRRLLALADRPLALERDGRLADHGEAGRLLLLVEGLAAGHDAHDAEGLVGGVDGQVESLCGAEGGRTRPGGREVHEGPPRN